MLQWLLLCLVRGRVLSATSRGRGIQCRSRGERVASRRLLSVSVSRLASKAEYKSLNARCCSHKIEVFGNVR